MELAEWYIEHRPDQTFTRTLSINPPIIMKPDMKIEITLGHEVGHLQEVWLNQKFRTSFYLSNWKDGVFNFGIPEGIEELIITEVHITWS